MSIDLPPEKIMRQMAKLAMEQATLFFAKQAREFAQNIPEDATGSMALEAFARAIEANNATQWPREELLS